jgi:hypothetical protein
MWQAIADPYCSDRAATIKHLTAPLKRDLHSIPAGATDVLQLLDDTSLTVSKATPDDCFAPVSAKIASTGPETIKRIKT